MTAFNRIFGFLDSLPRSKKIMLVMGGDVSLCVLSVWLSYFIRMGEIMYLSKNTITAFVISVCLAIPIFQISGLYKEIFRYSGLTAYVKSFLAVNVYALFYFLIFSLIGIQGVPRSIGVFQPVLLMIFLITFRVTIRFWFEEHLNVWFENTERQKTLIYGAGSDGRQIANALAGNKEMLVMGFLEDDKKLHGHVLNGKPIYNSTDLGKLVKKLKISHVLLSAQNINTRQKNQILEQIRRAKVPVYTLPSVSDLAEGKVKMSELRWLDINDLLGREVVIPDKVLMGKNITGMIVMVTGAGGSIGSELCRQIVHLNPRIILLVEQNEFALYNIHQELEAEINNVYVIPLLASAQDADRMDDILATWHPHTVYHAAAYKHVPLVEQNLSEGIKNNVLGALVTAQASINNKVKNFVLISTDKAVRPTNIMGASKRLSEMVLQALAAENSFTILSMVRFGNVLDSSGSVVPKFRQQIKEGGPVTITHAEITRFFMTIPEASQLVIQAGAMARGGDVFVLDMGEPVKIIKLAKRMIELSGLSVKNEQNPDGDIEIEITKLRPGEKLFEELLIGDNPEATSHHRIMKAHETFLEWGILENEIKSLIVALNKNDVSLIRYLLEKLVTEYRPDKDIVDWVYLAKEKEGLMH